MKSTSEILKCTRDLEDFNWWYKELVNLKIQEQIVS